MMKSFVLKVSAICFFLQILSGQAPASSHLQKIKVAGDQTSQMQFPILSMKDYMQLSKAQRESYVREFRKALREFEASAQTKIPSVGLFLWMENAWADDAAPTANWKGMERCLIGGVFRTPLDDGRCPTSGRPCGGDTEGNKFECGLVYDNVCVDRYPIAEISQRCEQNAKNEVKDETWKKIPDDYGAEIAKICKDPAGTRLEPCKKLSARLTALKRDLPGASGSPPAAPPPATDDTTPKPDNPANSDEEKKCEKVVQDMNAVTDRGVISTITAGAFDYSKCQKEFETSFHRIFSQCKNVQGAVRQYWDHRLQLLTEKRTKFKLGDQSNMCGQLSRQGCDFTISRDARAANGISLFKNLNEENWTEFTKVSVFATLFPIQRNTKTNKLEFWNGGNNWYFCDPKTFSELCTAFDKETNHKLLGNKCETKDSDAKPKKSGVR